MTDFYAIYDALIAEVRDITPDARLLRTETHDAFAFAECAGQMGIAMAGDQAMVAPKFPSGLTGLTVGEAAEAVKSWNLREAAMALAAVNTCCNTPERIERLDCAEPFENHAVRGLCFDGATVGIVGHMRLTDGVRRSAARIYTLERRPQPGDYPDSACEVLLPQCDYVFITGSSIMNKTLPRLLELSRNAYTVLLGPSVPLCPALLTLGVDRLSGMAVTDIPAMREHVRSLPHRSPYAHGTPFMLTK